MSDEATVEAVAKAEAERRGLPCPDGEADDQSGWTFVEGATWGAAYQSARGDVKADRETVIEQAFERIGEAYPWSGITRADIEQWIELFDSLALWPGRSE